MLEGFISTNKYGNKELRTNDSKGGHVTVILNAEDTRFFSGDIGLVASYTHNNVGGTEILRTIEDIDNNIEGIKRINRIDSAQKQLLIDFLTEIRKEITQAEK